MDCKNSEIDKNIESINNEKKVIFSSNSSKDKNKVVDNILQEKDKKICDLTNDLQRLQAEFENYQKRMDKQNNYFREFANASLIEALFPVLDSLESGLKHNKDFVNIYEQLLSILKKNGLEKIEVEVGNVFDHNKMDCLFQEKNNCLNDDQVVQILSTGYKLNGKIIRTAKVSVNKLDLQKNMQNNKENNKDENSLNKNYKNNFGNCEKNDNLKENDYGEVIDNSKEKCNCGEKNNIKDGGDKQQK